MKKILTILMALTLALSLSVPAYAESDYDTPIEITWMIPTQQSISLGESVPTQILLEKFNIQVNWIELNPVDQHPEKLNLLLASQQLPDVVSWVDKDFAARYGDEGAFLEITPYLASNFPNLSVVVNEESSAYYSAYTLDDQLWYIPIWERTSGPNWGWSINKEAFEEVGYPVESLNTFADYKAALEALKAAYPDSYPLAARASEYDISNFLSSFIIPFTKGMANYSVMGFDYEQKTWSVAANISGYKEALMYINELYTEGLLDPEFLTCDMNTLILMLANDQAFATVDYVGGLSGVGDVQSQVNDVLYPIEWPSPSVDEESIMGTKAIALGSTGTVLSANIMDDPEKFERVCAMLDYMYSDEWYDILYNNSDILTDDGTTYVEGYYVDSDNLRDLYIPWALYACFQDDPLRVDVEPGTAWSDFSIKWGNEWTDRLVDNIIMPFDTDTQTEINDLTNSVQDYWSANVMQFVIGRTDFSEWDTFVEGLMNAGGTQLEQIYNDFYQELYGD